MPMFSRRAAFATIAAAATVAAAPVHASPRPAGRLVVTVEAIEAFRLEVNRRGDWIIVRLRASGGLTGIGDASHSGDDPATIRELSRLFALARGRDVTDVAAFRQAVARQEGAAPTRAASVAASALEQCLWDLAGQTLGVPVSTLFGGALQATIPLYANINRSTEPRTPAGFAAQARAAIADGFDTIKLAPFDAIPPGLVDPPRRTALTDAGIACAQAVRDAIGPGNRLLIDAHARFDVAQGTELARRLAPLDLGWLEEVTPAKPLSALPEINRIALMPTAGGEALHGVAAFFDYIRAGAVDIAMPDVKICGGMIELRKIGAVAEAAGLAVSPHGPASPIGTLAAAHVAASLSNFTELEHAYGEVPWRAELLDPPERIERGQLRLADRPGLGHTLNVRTLARRGRSIAL